MKKVACLVVMWVLLAGCGGKTTYIQPTQTYKANNSIVVNKPRSEVWKQIVPALGSSFFVINNLDKESGFINLSYTGDPEKYVDCGILESYVKNARGERTYRFPAATAYKEYESMDDGQNLVFVKRKMDLEGRINIILQEASASGTLVTVNTKYVVTKDVVISNAQGLTHRSNDTVSFNTNGHASFPQGTECHATGTLEQEVLSALGVL